MVRALVAAKAGVGAGGPAAPSSRAQLSANVSFAREPSFPAKSCVDVVAEPGDSIWGLLLKLKDVDASTHKKLTKSASVGSEVVFNVPTSLGGMKVTRDRSKTMTVKHLTDNLNVTCPSLIWLVEEMKWRKKQYCACAVVDGSGG